LQLNKYLSCCDGQFDHELLLWLAFQSNWSLNEFGAEYRYALFKMSVTIGSVIVMKPQKRAPAAYVKARSVVAQPFADFGEQQNEVTQPT